ISSSFTAYEITSSQKMLLWLRYLIACRKCQFRTRVSGLNPTSSLSATLPVLTACSPISSELRSTLTPELIRKKPKTSSMLPPGVDPSDGPKQCLLRLLLPTRGAPDSEPRHNLLSRLLEQQHHM